jgi:hypothetical protein
MASGQEFGGWAVTVGSRVVSALSIDGELRLVFRNHHPFTKLRIPILHLTC